MTTKYQIAYQLGARGPTMHRTLSTAIKALESAKRTAAAGGDCQGIGLVAHDDDGERPLTIEEYGDDAWREVEWQPCAPGVHFQL